VYTEKADKSFPRKAKPTVLKQQKELALSREG
jgi:hypothetical protein